MRSSWFRRLLRPTLVFLAVILLLLGLTWLILPRWVQGSGAQLASEALGREVSIEQVSFQPWRLGLVVEGLKVAGGKGEPQPLLTVARVDVALSLRSLLHLSPVLSSLTIDRPMLRLARTGEGRFDIDDLIERFSKPKPTPGPKSEPPDFALYNIRLHGGEIQFDDQPVQRRHVISELFFDLPFISSFDADEKVEVQPAWGGKLGGVAFGGKGEVLPFASPPEASVDFHVERLDLAPYLGYVPRSLPLHPTQGLLTAALKLRFAKSALALSGELGLDRVAVQTPDGKPMASWDALQVGLKDVQPLKRQLLLGQIRWRGLRAALGPDKLPKPGASVDDKKAPAPAWRLGLDGFQLEGASLAWRQAASLPVLKADDIGLKLGALQWPLLGSTSIGYSLKLQGAALSGEGSLAEPHLNLGLSWKDLDLAAVSPYLQQALPLKLKGRGNGEAQLSIAEPLKPDAQARVELALKGLGLRDLTVANARNEALFNAAAVTLDEAQVQLGPQHIVLGKLEVSRPIVQLVREHDGRWHHELPATAQGEAAGKPWTLALGALGLDGGAVKLRDASFGDRSPGDTLAVDAEAIKVRLGKLSWPSDGKAVPASVSLNLGAPRARANQRGTLHWKGQVALAPLAASGHLRLAGLPLQWLDDALDPAWGLRLRRAELGWLGSFALRQQGDGWQAHADGDLQLADLRLAQLTRVDGKRANGPNLLSWQSLHLDGTKFAWATSTTPQLAVRQVKLDDFYASLAVDEQGQLNLQQIGAPPAGPAKSASAPASGPALRLSIQSTELSQGKVDYSDHFVKPNYSAQLTDLSGSLGAFSADQATSAALQLRGKVAGTGLLEVKGSINPAVSPPVLDITANATDIELAPLSPYSGKYAGYEIERGKLSSKLHYKIESGGRLQAENQLILNQLTFGHAVDSPDATKLPVRLAVALLKDRDGVIDINLPISGSINDPEFSIGGLVVKAIINLIGKALTSPFSLFSGSGGADLSQIVFAPGSGEPADPSQLDRIAKLMTGRPGVTLTVTGWADLAHERAALQQRSLDDAMTAERRRELRRQKATTESPVQLAALSPADRDRLLKQVYGNAKLPNKPSNLIGMDKDLPPAEMRALLLPSYPVDAQRIHDLALARSVTLRDALIAKGLPNARIFLAAPREGGPDLPADWQPRADLKLGAD